MQRRLKDSEHERAVEILERGLWVDPPRSFWNPKRPSKLQKRAMKQVFTRSFVTASHLHKWGYQLEPLCPFCRDGVHGTIDGVWHRCFECPALADRRAEHLPAEWAAAGLEAGPEDPFFSSLWLPVPNDLHEPTWEEKVCFVGPDGPVEPFRFNKNEFLYSDGS
eukprot:2921337-Pyramimonas_sp.AAC.1